MLPRSARIALLAASFALHAPGQQPAPSPPAAQPAPTPPAQAPVPATRNSASGTFTLQRYTRLVILDVVVTDSRGDIVSNLGRNDFVVTENKEPQTLLDFRAPATLPRTAGLSINSTAELDREAPDAPVNIIVLDEFNTRFEDMAYARYSLRKFLDRQPGTLSSPTMLIAVSLQKFSVLSDYTQNKQQLLDALNHHLAAYPWQVHEFAWISERFTAAFAAITRVAEATIGHPGHKNMIWLGRGFPTVSLQNLTVDSEDRIDSVVQSCINELRDARVTLYSMDPAGVMINPSVYGTDFTGTFAEDAFGGNYSFTRLVQATGGRAFFGRNDVDAEIRTGIRDGSSFYTLTYRPTNSSQNPQKFRRIRIDLPEHPGYKAVAREGYYPERGPGRVNPEKPSALLAFDLHNASTSNLVYDGVALTLSHPPNDTEHFKLAIAPQSLTWAEAQDAQPRYTEFIVMSTTFDKKGKELNSIARHLRVVADGPDTPPRGRLEHSVTVNYRLVPDSRAVRVRFIVRVSATGRIGSAESTLLPGNVAVGPTAPAPGAPSSAPAGSVR